MMKLKFIASFCLTVAVVFVLSSCHGKQSTAATSLPAANADVEVIYFYGKQRCVTCRAMEQLAREAVDSVFADKVKDGILAFTTVDITTPEGEAFADSYEVTSSSIFIVDNRKSPREKVNLTAFGFRNARNNSSAYKQGIIDHVNKLVN